MTLDQKIGVSKYGGSSLGTVEMFETTANISMQRLESGLDQLVEVVSAIGKVDDTPEGNKLTNILENIYYGKDPEDNDKHLKSRIKSIIEKLEIKDKSAQVLINSCLSELFSMIKPPEPTGQSDKRYAKIVSMGERITGAIKAAHYRKLGIDAVYLDFDEFGMLTETRHKDSDILPVTQNGIKREISNRDEQIVVVPGFIGFNMGGEITTLGRNASDYSATVIAAALDAEAYIYSDKPGLLRADPDFVPDAEALEQVTYREAKEFAEVGANIIASRAITPARRARIPIRILNTFNPGDKGTLISPEIDSRYKGVKAIASHAGYDILTISQEDMGRGAFAEVTDLFKEQGINLSAVADGGSESFSLAIKPDANENYQKNIGYVLTSLRDAGYDVKLTTNRARLALIGEGMNDQTGVLEQFYSVLSDLGIRRSLISQGEDSIMISTFIPEAHLRVTVQKLYHAMSKVTNGPNA